MRWGWGPGVGRAWVVGGPAEVAQLGDEERHEGPARALRAEDRVEAVDDLLVERGAQRLARRRVVATQQVPLRNLQAVAVDRHAPAARGRRAGAGQQGRWAGAAAGV